jgi:phosphoribulokinase
MAEAERRGQRNFSHFGHEANLLAELEDAVPRPTPKPAPARPQVPARRRRGRALRQDPGTFTPWQDLPGTELLFYEGLHGGVVTDNVDIAQHPDLLIGVVPVINLEWIQKLHRDKQHARLLAPRR